jgi:hypothetical protein
LWLLWLLCLAVTTLAPFDFTADLDTSARVRDAFRPLVAESVPTHIGLNVLLFVPLGVLLVYDPRYAKSAGLPVALRAAVAGVVISCCIEAAQLFLADRVSSIIDVGANALGAIAGASACVIGGLLLARQRERAAHYRGYSVPPYAEKEGSS